MMRSACALGLWLAVVAAPAAAGPASYRVTIRQVPFDLEVAADPESRERGLSGRERLPARGGMLFVFPDEVPRAFWMRDCLIDLGLVFLDGEGRVVAVYEMQKEPPRAAHESESAYLSRLRRYASGAPARYAIEVRSGVVSSLGIVRGEYVRLVAPPRAAR